MNSRLFTFLKSGLVLSFMMLYAISEAQLSGNYTIDPTKSASSSNYVDWSSAVSDLLSGTRSDGGTAQGPGISASVTFTAYDTTYTNVSLEFNRIPGSNPSRRVTFKSAGGDRNKCILSNPSSSSTSSDFVVMLRGTDYVTFKDIQFYRTGSNAYSTVVQLSDTATGNQFDNCFFRGRKVPSSVGLGFLYLYGSCMYIVGKADSLEVKNCRFLYGYNGVYCDVACMDNSYVGNTLDTNGSSGMLIKQQTRLKVTDNTYNMGDFGPNQGHYTSYGIRIESSPSVLITRNKIYMYAINAQVVRGIMVASITSSASSPTMITNNWIMNAGGTGDCTGLAVFGSNYVNMVYNNVLITSSLSNSASYYHYAQASTFVKLINNNLINKGAGYSLFVFSGDAGDFDTVNYNNLFSSGTYIARWDGTDYTTIANLKSGSGKDVNSINIDPGYVGSTNLHVSNIGINKKALRYDWVPYDIDMELRDTSGPDIGADEFFPIANDAGVTSVDSPQYFCAGSQKVKVRFQNYGFDTLKSLTINWKVNSSTQTSFSWTGILAPGQSSASIPLGTYTFASNTPYNVMVWTSDPNNLTDGKSANDTLSLIKAAGLSGTYTVGDSAGTDFKSFNNAIAGFTSRGICGPITFKVRPGVYNEQLTLLQLPGMNVNNPIKFESAYKDSSKVIVTLASTTATGTNNAAVQLRGADYITFQGITFERTGDNTYYGQVVHILNGARYNTFKNCRMLGLKVTGGNVNAVNIWSDQGRDEYNTFENNTVRFGQVCVDYTGADTARENGTVFRGNTFDSSYTSLVKVSFNNGIKFENNTFMRQYSAVAGNFSLNLNDCDGEIGVTANKFFDGSAETSLSLLNCAASSSNPGIIANNFFAKGNGKSINIDLCDYQNFAHNSIYHFGLNTTNIGINSALSSSSNLTFVNNNIVMDAGQVIFIPNGTQVAYSNYNNFVAKGGSFAYWGAAYNNITDLSLASGKDGNSKSVNPLFKGSLDLHIINPRLKKAGTGLTYVTTDIDGEARNSTTPDIGADEFLLSANDAGVVELIEPVTGSCAGIYDLKISITNFGSDTLKSVDVNWTAQNIAQTTYKWTGTLLSNESDTFIIGSFNFLNALNPKFAFWTKLPNGNSDAIDFNDSLILNKSMRSLPTANAGADVDVCIGESVQIGPTSINGFSYKWTDINNNLVSNNSKVIVSPTVNTTYVLEVTNTTFGCKRNDTIIVNVKSLPVVNAGSNAKVCYGSTAQIGENKVNGFLYQWSSIPSGFSATNSKINVQPTVTTKYILRKADSMSNCLNRDTVEVQVALPPITSISGVNTVCETFTQSYAAPNVSGDSYNWTLNGGGTIQSGQGSNSIAIKWNTPGNYNVNVIQTNADGCKDTADVNVNVNRKPKAVFNVTSVCQGATTDFINTSNDANSYFWYFGDNNNSSTQSPTHQYDTSGVYDVKLIAIGNNCYDTLIKQTTVYPLPIANFASTKTAGKKYAFTDNSNVSSGTITSWEWNFGDGGSDNTQNPTYSYALVGNYNVQLCVTSSNGCKDCFSKFTEVTSINMLTADPKIKVMPNPGNGNFEVKGEENLDQIVVLNSLGQEVMSVQVNGNSQVIDLSELADGVYVFRVKYGDTWSLVRVVNKTK